MSGYVRADKILSDREIAYARTEKLDDELRKNIIAILEQSGGLTAYNVAWRLMHYKSFSVGGMTNVLLGMGELELDGRTGKFSVKKSN
jgi:hypothetical protein